MKAWIQCHYIPCVCAWVVVCGIASIWLFVTGRAAFVAVMLFYLTATFLGAIILAIPVVNDFNHAMIKLQRSCDPEPLLQICEAITRWNQKSLFYRVHEGWALLLLGRSEEAKVVLEPLSNNSKLWKKKNLIPIYCICRFDLEPIETAEIWLDRWAQELNVPENDRALEEQRADLALRQGRTEGLELIFMDRFTHATLPAGLVSGHNQLGKLYLLEGRKEEAAEHLRYVAEHGNKLAIRAEAEELLKSM